jgi:membrane protease YdiL (CAAX protease family)
VTRRAPTPGQAAPHPAGQAKAAGRWTRPQAGLAYPAALLGPGDEPGSSRVINRGVTLVLMGVLGYLVVYLGGTNLIAALGWLAGGREGTLAEYYEWAVTGFGSPWGIWAAHFGLAILTLLIWAVYRLFLRRRLGWLWSVAPGVRWRYGLLCLAAATVIFTAYAGVEFALGDGWAAPAGWGWYLLPILVTSPLQALGEEVLFRGLLLQALGLILRRPWFPIVASAAVFAVFHGAQNPWLFASRFAFGVLAGALVWRTGGLEAPIAAHVLNNVAAFTLGLVTGQLTATRTVTAVAPLAAVAEVGVFALFTAVAWALGRVLRLRRETPAGAA